MKQEKLALAINIILHFQFKNILFLLLFAVLKYFRTSNFKLLKNQRIQRFRFYFGYNLLTRIFTGNLAFIPI